MHEQSGRQQRCVLITVINSKEVCSWDNYFSYTTAHLDCYHTPQDMCEKNAWIIIMFIFIGDIIRMHSLL